VLAPKPALPAADTGGVPTTAAATQQAIASQQNVDMPSDDAIRKNQMALLQQLGIQSEQAGTTALTNAQSQLRPYQQSALENALQSYYLNQVGAAGQTTDDPITAALRAQYQTDAGKARNQQIEDLQRFGVLGGQGASAGGVADVLGTFDAGVLQGNLNLSADQQKRLQDAVAQSQSFYGTQSGLAEGARQFDFGAGMQSLGLQQDVANQTLSRLLTQTEPTQREVFEQGVADTNKNRALAEGGLLGTYQGQQTLGGRAMTQEEATQSTGRAATIAGLTGTYAGKDTLQAFLAKQQLGQGQQALGLQQQQITNQAQQFAQSLGLDYTQLSQQDRQFVDSLAQQNTQFGQSLAEQTAGRQQQNTQFGQSLTQQGTQFSQSLAEQVAGRQQQGQQFTSAQEQQSAQFAQGLGLDYAQLSQQDRQFIDSMAQQQGQFGQSLAEQVASRQQQGQQFTSAQDQQAAQFAQSIGLDYAQLSQQDKQFLASLAEQTAGREQQGQQFTSAQEQQAAQFAQTLGLDYAQLSQQDRQFVDQLALAQSAEGRAQSQFTERDPIALAIAAQQAGIPMNDYDLTARIRAALGLGNVGDDPGRKSPNPTPIPVIDDASQAPEAAPPGTVYRLPDGGKVVYDNAGRKTVLPPGVS